VCWLRYLLCCSPAITLRAARQRTAAGAQWPAVHADIRMSENQPRFCDVWHGFVCAHRQLQRFVEGVLMHSLKGKPVARRGRKASGLKPNGVR
jgi:hypothetical protein